MKKIISAILMMMLVLAVFITASAQEKTLYYPSYLQETEGETLVLEKEPERIVCLSDAALQILVRCGVRPIAICEPSSSVEYPDWVYELPIISIGMKTLDVEAILSCNPDLVLLGSYQKDNCEAIFQSSGIPAYYTSEGPSITYKEAREEAITLARSFGTEELAKEIEGEFEAVEARAADYCATHDKQTMMIFFHTPGGYQQTSQGYLGSMLSMLPFENLSDGLLDPSMRTAPIDVETAITQNPDIIFAISPAAPNTEVLQQTFEEAFNENADLWNQLDAVKNKNIIYLSGEYVTSKGIQVIDSVNALIDMLEERFPNEKAAEETVAEEKQEDAEETAFVLNYPENLQKLGFTEPLKLDKRPERVASMSTSPVLALYEMGVPMVAIPESSANSWPEELLNSSRQYKMGMHSTFDVELLVAEKPDLVIMGYTSQEKYGNTLEGLGIPVYYVDAAHTVSYESIKMLTEELIAAFAPDSEIGTEIMSRFDALETRLEQTKQELAGKTVMVLQSAPPSHYIQTNGGTLGSMAEMIGLTNVYENGESPMAPIDLELAVTYDPDLVLSVGMSPEAEGHKALMEEEFKKNPDYWNSIEAIANGDILYMPVSYVTTGGIAIVDRISELADQIEAFFTE